MVGALLMTVIKTGGTHLGLPNWVPRSVTGAIILAAVAIDRAASLAYALRARIRAEARSLRRGVARVSARVAPAVGPRVVDRLRPGVAAGSIARVPASPASPASEPGAFASRPGPASSDTTHARFPVTAWPAFTPSSHSLNAGPPPHGQRVCTAQVNCVTQLPAVALHPLAIAYPQTPLWHCAPCVQAPPLATFPDRRSGGRAVVGRAAARRERRGHGKRRDPRKESLHRGRP